MGSCLFTLLACKFFAKQMLEFADCADSVRRCWNFFLLPEHVCVRCGIEQQNVRLEVCSVEGFPHLVHVGTKEMENRLTE